MSDPRKTASDWINTELENNRLRERVAELKNLLNECANRLELCAVNSGTTAEYAAIAVEKYRKALV